MNLDEIFHLEATDPLVATSPLLLGGCILAAILAGWFCARRYANTNDIEKSVRLYLPLGAAGGRASPAVRCGGVFMRVGGHGMDLQLLFLSLTYRGQPRKCPQGGLFFDLESKTFSFQMERSRIRRNFLWVWIIPAQRTGS